MSERVGSIGRYLKRLGKTVHLGQTAISFSWVAEKTMKVSNRTLNHIIEKEEGKK